MNANVSSLKIVSGPNAATLKSALLYAYSDELKVSPIITMASGEKREKVELKRVIGLDHEDGSGHKLIVEADIDGENKRLYFNTALRAGRFLSPVNKADESFEKIGDEEIIDGPSAEMLANAWLYAFSDEATITPTVTIISNGTTKKVTIDRVTGLHHKDDSGHHFIVWAHVDEKRKKIFYDSADRKGYFLS